MEPSPARICISVKDGVFELSGSEAFVSQQIENFKDLIQKTAEKLEGKYANQSAAPAAGANEEAERRADIGQTEATDGKDPAATPATDGTKKEFPNALHLEGEKVQLLKTVPGSVTSKRAVNCALAYLWAKRSIGVDNVPFGEIRQLCEDQGCLDKTNFAQHMQNARQFFVVDGAKGSSLKVVKLTRPGIDAAEKLLTELNGS